MIKTFFVTTAVLVTATAQAAAAQGKCLLEVNGHAYIKGACKIEVSKDGSFDIGTGGQSAYFAYVNLDEPLQARARQTAEGFWNGEHGESHAHTPLGTLTRDGACWSNQTAKVCAWR